MNRFIAKQLGILLPKKSFNYFVVKQFDYLKNVFLLLLSVIYNSKLFKGINYIKLNLICIQ